MENQMELHKILAEVQTQFKGKEEPTQQKTHLFDPTDVRKGFLSGLNKKVYINSRGKKLFSLNEENEFAIDAICAYINKEHQKLDSLGIDPDKGVMLFGNYGSGKTIIMEVFRDMLMLPEFNRKMPIVKCQFVVDEYRRIDPSTGKHKGMLAIDPFVKKEADEKIFDDLGEEEVTIKDFGNAFSPMAYIINKRNELQKFGHVTHFTSNDAPSVFESKYGGRIASRLAEMVNPICLGRDGNSIDYRRVK